MHQPESQVRPYALKTGEGWTYRFGIGFTVKAGEVQECRGAAFLKYVKRQGEEPNDHTHKSEMDSYRSLSLIDRRHCAKSRG